MIGPDRVVGAAVALAAVALAAVALPGNAVPTLRPLCWHPSTRKGHAPAAKRARAEPSEAAPVTLCPRFVPFAGTAAPAKDTHHVNGNPKLIS